MTTVRMVIAQEGKMMPDGRIILPGAITCKDDRIPVTENFQHDRIVGHASNMMRDERTGEIYMDIELDDERTLFKPETDNLGAYVTLSDVQTRDHHQQVVEGRLRQVTIRDKDDGPAFPKQ